MRRCASSAAASKLSVGAATSFADAPIPPSEREFLINGWRWHHRSVLRELRVASLQCVVALLFQRGGFVADVHGDDAAHRVDGNLTGAQAPHAGAGEALGTTQRPP